MTRGVPGIPGESPISQSLLARTTAQRNTRKKEVAVVPVASKSVRWRGYPRFLTLGVDQGRHLPLDPQHPAPFSSFWRCWEVLWRPGRRSKSRNPVGQPLARRYTPRVPRFSARPRGRTDPSGRTPRHYVSTPCVHVSEARGRA